MQKSKIHKYFDTQINNVYICPYFFITQLTFTYLIGHGDMGYLF